MTHRVGKGASNRCCPALSRAHSERQVEEEQGRHEAPNQGRAAPQRWRRNERLGTRLRSLSFLFLKFLFWNFKETDTESYVTALDKSRAFYQSGEGGSQAGGPGARRLRRIDHNKLSYKVTVLMHSFHWQCIIKNFLYSKSFQRFNNITSFISYQLDGCETESSRRFNSNFPDY